MTTDDFGSVVYPGSIDNGAIDTEHSPILYPPKSERICAQDERFASQNEAIGLLEYKLEQHITQCADGLAPLADFISASWAVIDELVTRIEQLEAAQPIPQIQRLPDEDALTDAYIAGLEDGMRGHTVRKDEVTLSRDAYDELKRQAAIGRSVPWAGLVELSAWPCERPTFEADAWIAENAPKQEAAE